MGQPILHRQPTTLARHLRGLTDAHLVHIFETSDQGWDYEAWLRATLARYRPGPALGSVEE